MYKIAETNQFYNRASCCWNCQVPGHRSSECNRNKRLFCSYCLKEGIATKHCGCRPARRTVARLTPHTEADWIKFPECSQASKASEAPLWIGVGDESFRTFLNTANSQTKVGWRIAVKSSLAYGTCRKFVRQDNEIVSESLIPLRHRNTVRTLRCQVVEEPSDQIMLGTDALKCFGFQMTLNSYQSFNWMGCSDSDHRTVYEIPIIRSVERTKFPPRTPLVPKNPVDLSLAEELNPDSVEEPVDNRPSIDSALDNLEERTQSWENLLLSEASDAFSKVVDSKVSVMTDSEMEEYLMIDDTDQTELEKL